MAEPRIIVEHLSGARWRRRQTFAMGQTVRFGRHPESEVRFHAHRDIDASSRHAELSPQSESEYLLRDVGSSNGTYIDGQRANERLLRPGQAAIVAFGENGPRVRIYVGDPDELPPIPRRHGELGVWTPGYRLMLVGVIACILAIAAVAWALFV